MQYTFIYFDLQHRSNDTTVFLRKIFREKCLLKNRIKDYAC